MERREKFVNCVRDIRNETGIEDDLRNNIRRYVCCLSMMERQRQHNRSFIQNVSLGPTHTPAVSHNISLVTPVSSASYRMSPAPKMATVSQSSNDSTANSTNYNAGPLLGAVSAGVIIVIFAIILVIGLVCCRDESPCRLFATKFALKRSRKQQKKHEAILTALGCTGPRRTPIIRQDSLDSDRSSGILVYRDTYDGLTAIEKVYGSMSRSTTDGSGLSSTSSHSNSAYSFFDNTSSIGIDSYNRPITSSIRSFRPNFSPLYNCSLSYISHKRLSRTSTPRTYHRQADDRKPHRHKIPHKKRQVVRKSLESTTGSSDSSCYDTGSSYLSTSTLSYLP